MNTHFPPAIIVSLLGSIALPAVYFSIRWTWWRPTVSLKSPRILMYHMICETKSHHKFKGLRVSPKKFEQQVKWLKSNGWTFLTMSELTQQQNCTKCVAITFDDGFADNYTHALPILRKYDAKATIYLVENRHENDWSINRKKHHNTGELARETKASDQQVKEMIQSGVFELGGHTRTHYKLTDLSSSDKRDEISESRKRLQSLYDASVTSFAYPFGIYDRETLEIVKEAGYQTAVTVEEGVADLETPLELKRIKVSGKEGMFSFKLRIRTGKRKL